MSEPAEPDRPAVEIRMPLRVRYHECDQQGVVFNAHYLAYVDMASYEVFDALVGGYQALLDLGVDVVVAESTLRYRASARFRDELTVVATVERLGTTSLVLGFRIERGAELILTGRNRYVVVDTDGHRPTPLPDAVRAGLARALPAAPVGD